MHFVWFIPSDALRIKTSSKYLTHLLAVLKERFQRNKNSHYDTTREIVSLKDRKTALDLTIVRGAFRTFSNIIDKAYL